MHQQRLAAAGGHPEGEFVELWPSLSNFVEGRDLVSLALTRVVGGRLHVQFREQRFGITEIAVQVDLTEKQGQVLEVLPNDRGSSPRVIRLSFNRCVCLTMFWSYSSSNCGGQLRQVEVVRHERVVEAMDVVLVHPFQRLIA